MGEVNLDHINRPVSEGMAASSPDECPYKKYTEHYNRWMRGFSLRKYGADNNPV